MTFSGSRIVKLINDSFIPVWESVAPVRIATFDLGEGRSVKGTISGEIALYFCTEQGEVFDILPALQSPAATLVAIKEALAFYEKHNGNPTYEDVRQLHLSRIKKQAGETFDQLLATGRLDTLPQHIRTKQGIEQRNAMINQAADDATRDMRYMIYSKTSIAEPEPITVVEPGGLNYFRYETARRFVSPSQWESPTIRLLLPESPEIPLKKSAKRESRQPKIKLRTPSEWKLEIFPYIMRQELKGGEVTYDSSSLEAIRIISE